MKRFTRYICLCLAMATLLSFPVHAMESVAPKASSFFGSSSVYLYKIAGTTFDACFDVTGTGMMDVIGASVIKIQRSSDGVNWETMRTYTMEDYPSLVCSNTAGHMSSIRYAGTRGHYYRAYIELYAKNSSGYGTMGHYTSSIYFPAS